MNTGGKKLKVAFFSEDFSRQAKGTAIVIQKLVEQLLIDFPDQIELTLIRKEGLCGHPTARKIRNIEIRVYKTPIFSTLISYFIFFLANREEFDAVIFNRNVYPGFWFLNAKKFILWQHDAPENAAYAVAMPADVRLIDLFLKYAGKYFLDAVIAVSKAAREDIIGYYHMQPRKVFSIYNGAAESFRLFSVAEKKDQKEYLRTRYGIAVPYLLDVSRLDPHKNIETLLDAFFILKTHNRLPHKLVIVGGRHLPAYDALIESKIDDLHLRGDVIIAPYIDENDMPAVYNLADALLFPSLLEGFGLPLIEAMKCGTPVVASDLPVMAEVADGAALLVDPHDAGLLAAKTFAVLSDQHLKSELMKRGLERCKIFSWRSSARELVKILS